MRPRASAYGRGYIAEGHASDSPVAEPPRTNPLAGIPSYVPPSEPAVARLHPDIIGAFTLGSPSER